MEALSMPTPIMTAANVVAEVAHAMRVELSFVLFFGCLYLMNRHFFPKSLTTNRKHMGKAGPALRQSSAALPRGAAATRAVPSAEATGSRRRPVSEGQPAKATDRHFAPQPPSGSARSFFDEGGQELRNPRPEQLRDPEWFTKAVLTLKSVQVLRTVEVYKSAMRLGLDLSQLSPSKGEEVFVALVTAAIRANQPLEALDMLKTCKASGFRISIGLAASATKLCTSKQYYKECLMIYDFLQEDGSLTLDERSVWSCLLFCAVEARTFNRCSFFWKQMQSCGTPSNKDYGNMIRFASNQREWQLTLSLISEMQKKGVDVDNVVYNTALATCVSAGRTDEARALLEEMEASEGVVDVITYNTLAKGYAKGGKMAQCFDLYEHMRERGITPSEVTYGILLDCCINENQMEKADKVFNRMTQEGCVMNTVLYTTLIKGFARARQVDQAMRVYKKMLDDRAITPDLITFSILIKANCDAGGLAEAMELLETMKSLNLVPDEVIFNNLLSGCVQKNDQELGKRLYHDMVKAGLRPSNATFSIMLRLYSSCKLLEEALELLRAEPAKFGVEPEQRLFVQLAQACLRERQGRVAVDVYSLMVKHGSPTPAMTGSLLAMCSKLNMLGTGAELLDLAAKAKVKVDERDIKDLRQTAVRKKKANFVEQIDACQTLILGARK